MRGFIKRRIFIFLFPLIALLITVGALFAVNNNDELKYSFVIDLNEEVEHRKVYLLDEDNYLVPLTIETKVYNDLANDIYNSVALLRDESVLTDMGYTNTINSNVKIQSIELNDRIVNIDFSKEFNEHDKNKEEKLIESLTWTLMQYDEIDGITVSVDGVKLEKLSNSGIEIPEILDKSIGINRYYNTSNNIYSGKDVTIYYEKENFGELVYVPVTKRVKVSDDVSSILRAINEDISTVSGLRKINNLSYIIDINQENDELVVSLSNDALIEEGIVDKEIYELIVLTFCDLNDIKVNINVNVNDELVMVDGYINDDNIIVSSIIINEIKA